MKFTLTLSYLAIALTAFSGVQGATMGVVTREECYVQGSAEAKSLLSSAAVASEEESTPNNRTRSVIQKRQWDGVSSTANPCSFQF